MCGMAAPHPNTTCHMATCAPPATPAAPNTHSPCRPTGLPGRLVGCAARMNLYSGCAPGPFTSNLSCGVGCECARGKGCVAGRKCAAGSLQPHMRAALPATHPLLPPAGTQHARQHSLTMMSNCVPNFFHAYSRSSSELSGAWPPNWLPAGQWWRGSARRASCERLRLVVQLGCACRALPGTRRPRTGEANQVEAVASVCLKQCLQCRVVLVLLVRGARRGAGVGWRGRGW